MDVFNGQKKLTHVTAKHTLPSKEDNFILSEEDDFIHPAKMTTAHFAVSYSCINAPPAAE